MDYKEKYESALERARIWKDKSGMQKDKQGILDDIFQELKESEDERIRKVLVGFFKSYKEQGTCGAETFNGIPTDKILAWLEKQYEKKSTDNLTQQEAMDIAVAKCFNEQEAVDKVEPKFHEG